MNTPKTAALWELLREMGWSEDQRPVSFIMQSHEELEKELSDLEAGFDADGRTAAEACCEEFKQEQAARLKTLERQLSEETARADEQFALAMELAAKLETERALADRLAEALQDIEGRASDESILLHPDADAKGVVDDCWEWSEQALASWKAARDEARH